jgi:hypothetical protein
MRQHRNLLIAIILTAALFAGCSRGQGKRVIQPAIIPTSPVEVVPTEPIADGLSPTLDATSTSQPQLAAPTALPTGTATIDPHVDQTLNALDQMLNGIEKDLDSTDTLEDFK